MDYCYGPGRNLVVNGALLLHGMVGGSFWDEGFTASDVVHSLASLGPNADVTVRINSSGGVAHEGLAIHAVLTAHKGKVTTVVEGLAASAASIIVQAGAERVMAAGSMMMVHDASVVTVGDAAEHDKSKAYLEVVCASMATIYAAATGRPIEDVRAEMSAETWLTAEDAVSEGYADRVGAANTNEPAPFPFRAYAHAPQRLVAMADAKGWSKRPLPTAAATAAALTPRHQENPMATPPAGNGPAIPPNPSAALAAAVDGAKPAASSTSVSRADASEIVTLCIAGGVSAMAASLIAEGLTVAEAKVRIGAAGEIKNLVALARRADPTIPETLTADLIGEGKSVEQARAALFDKLVARDEATAVSSHHTAEKPPAVAGPEAAKSNMRAQLERSGLVKKGA